MAGLRKLAHKLTFSAKNVFREQKIWLEIDTLFYVVIQLFVLFFKF